MAYGLVHKMPTRKKHFISSDCLISKGDTRLWQKDLLVQKEYAGTESKSETEKLLRQAMDDYESKKFIAKSENITIGELLDIWAEEELKTGTLSNGTVQNYLGAITNIKKHPISERKLKNVTSEHLQAFFDLLSFGGTYPDGSERKGYSKDYIRSFSAVLQQSFRFAVSPKQYITFNPMQYIKLKYQTDEVDLFSDDDMDGDIQPIPREDYERLIEFLQNYNPPAILPIQIAYYAGLRIGEACGLAWQDVNLEEQCLTIRRSIRYDGSRHKNIIGPTKRKKVRIVDFGDTLAEILRNARKEQLKNRMQYGELYHKNYYREVKDKNRVYYEFYHLDGTENVPEDYKEISFVCLRPDGSLELPSTLGIVCRKIAQKLDGFEGFHFHQLRHTYTSNLLANGAAPKDVQELLGHSDVSTTMNVYAHSTRKAKRESARLLDKVAGND
ncbi:Tyrosine recombinase XerC [Dorea longicatena]|nr:Tyrosine recombinase XerC [Dorea longicatena]